MATLTEASSVSLPRPTFDTPHTIISRPPLVVYAPKSEIDVASTSQLNGILKNAKKQKTNTEPSSELDDTASYLQLHDLPVYNPKHLSEERYERGFEVVPLNDYFYIDGGEAGSEHDLRFVTPTDLSDHRSKSPWDFPDQHRAAHWAICTVLGVIGFAGVIVGIYFMAHYFLTAGISSSTVSSRRVTFAVTITADMDNPSNQSICKYVNETWKPQFENSSTKKFNTYFNNKPTYSDFECKKTPLKDEMLLALLEDSRKAGIPVGAFSGTTQKLTLSFRVSFKTSKPDGELQSLVEDAVRNAARSITGTDVENVTAEQVYSTSTSTNSPTTEVVTRSSTKSTTVHITKQKTTVPTSEITSTTTNAGSGPTGETLSTTTASPTAEVETTEPTTMSNETSVPTTETDETTIPEVTTGKPTTTKKPTQLTADLSTRAPTIITTPATPPATPTSSSGTLSDETESETETEFEADTETESEAEADTGSEGEYIVEEPNKFAEEPNADIEGEVNSPFEEVKLADVLDETGELQKHSDENAPNALELAADSAVAESGSLAIAAYSLKNKSEYSTSSAMQQRSSASAHQVQSMMADGPAVDSQATVQTREAVASAQSAYSQKGEKKAEISIELHSAMPGEGSRNKDTGTQQGQGSRRDAEMVKTGSYTSNGSKVVSTSSSSNYSSSYSASQSSTRSKKSSSATVSPLRNGGKGGLQMANSTFELQSRAEHSKSEQSQAYQVEQLAESRQEEEQKAQSLASLGSQGSAKESSVAVSSSSKQSSSQQSSQKSTIFKTAEISYEGDVDDWTD